MLLPTHLLLRNMCWLVLEVHLVIRERERGILDPLLEPTALP